MQLSVPQRGVADSGSFPTEPADVGHWLEGLRPLASDGDAREVHRGLKHSNRLHNDPVRRRGVLERFMPVLRELHGQLFELTRAQPLPLAREFSRGATLVEALLREEAFAFKILLADSEIPDPEDARRAMQALAHQADVATHGYRRLPDALLEDAHVLYALAESRNLLEAASAPGVLTLIDHYRYILLLAAVDTRQLRVRQLPLALDFLREASAEITLRGGTTGKVTGDAVNGEAVEGVVEVVSGRAADGAYELGVDLVRSARPEPRASLLGSEPAALRTFGIDALLARIDHRIERTKAVRSNTLGVDVLERQTLGRLRSALARDRSRRLARTIANRPQPAVFGHKEIATQLLFGLGREAANDAPDRASPDVAPDRVAGWTLANHSSQGACLIHPACPPGTVQVGELVALAGLGTRERPSGTRPATSLGCVRWVHADGAARITLGLEYLARDIVAVTVTRSESESTIVEHALMIACKVQQSIVQTILLPPYLYAVGERLTASRGERSRELRLRACLQTNGLFGHFLID